jgi:pimeloyl-ACP methyl ester carboxylesterase
MARLQAGEVRLGWREWGGGDVTVVFIHGNLASKDWIELAAPLLPSGLRVIGIDWRGCGESDRPKANADYSNYSMQQHAEDMLAALDTLEIEFCHLATHSTGGIIAARMLLMQPQRFGRVFALDPVTPLGVLFNADQIGLFRSMMASKELTREVMATAASSLFVPESSRRALPHGSAADLVRYRRCSSEFWNKPSTFPKASGLARRSISPASGRAANWSAACRRSVIHTWCCGASAKAGFRQPISGRWLRQCRTAGSSLCPASGIR